MGLKLKIAAIPLDIAWGDVDENLCAVERALSAMPSDVDVVVLPELFSTGFVHDRASLEQLAENLSGKTIQALLRWAHTFNVAIAGSYLFRIGDKFFNRGFIVEPSGEEMFYDKRHLFGISPEASLFTAGESLPPIVRFRGWNLSMIICYDLRFPVWCRNQGMRYDVMLVPANWPDARSFAWSRLLSARAIENQAYYVGANRSGSDDYGHYDGMSMIVDGLGQIISEEVDGIVYATAEKDLLDNERRKLPVGKDSDNFKILI